jgi:hypothetical protein
MRIVNRKEFLALPSGTVFQKFTPCVFGDLQIKGSNCGEDDFADLVIPEVDANSCSEMDAILHKAEEDSSFSFDLDFECYGRDGEFQQDQLFAVWERKDIEGLIGVLTKCLSPS